MKNMDPVGSQELANRFNEDDSVWRRYEELRRLRLRLGIGSPLLPADVLDQLDWIQAQSEGRDTWCRGLLLNNPHTDTDSGTIRPVTKTTGIFH